MKNFKIEITEILQKVIEIKATNEEEAKQKVEKMYDDEEIVLDYNDFVNVDFKKI